MLDFWQDRTVASVKSGGFDVPNREEPPRVPSRPVGRSRAARRRSRWTVLTGMIVFLMVMGGVARPAAADTHITSDITTNTTWTVTGSPYLLDRQVKVASGATLTIDPGVTVEFNGGTYLIFFVNGTIKALGTPSDPVVFTSSQGAAGQGAPGQYQGVTLMAGTSSRFSYTRFEYGGSGSGGYYAYGALKVNNSTVSVDIDHSVFQHNAYSGLAMSDGVANVSYSTFSYNGNGISQAVSRAPGTLNLRYSTISNNVRDGLWFNVITNLDTPGSSIMSNVITANGRYGIHIEAYCSTPTTSFPHGNGNNIYANGNAEDPSGGTELHTLYICHALPVDWTGNYWGDVYFAVAGALTGPTVCGDNTSPPSRQFATDYPVQPGGYLAYDPWVDLRTPPPGPVSTIYYITSIPYACPPNGAIRFITVYNVYNAFLFQPGDVETSYIPIPTG
jgi:hypothetical protein